LRIIAVVMIVTMLLVFAVVVLFAWLLVFPISAWIVVHVVYPRWLRRNPGEPDYPVNVIVPCMGKSMYLEENLRAYAAQDYPRYTVTFVTDTPDDDANAVIAFVARGNPRVRHLVAGQSTSCAGKVHAMIAAVASDRKSEVFLFGDSDLRPDPHWAREMARPFLDPGVSVVTSHRWVHAEERGLAPSLYTVLSGHYCIYLATPFLAVVWGGAFGISRKAYEGMGIEKVWSTTASDDVALGNRMAELRVRPFYVPRGVCTSPEAHLSLGAMKKWFDRQALNGRIHQFPTWLGGLFVESLVCLALLGSLALLVVEAAAGSFDVYALAAPATVCAIAACSVIAKLTYPRRREIPLWQWAFVPLIGHFMIAASFWRPLFKNNTMTWGSFTYTVGRNKKVVRIEPAVEKPDADSRARPMEGWPRVAPARLPSGPGGHRSARRRG
jgi:glycosyltransferase involved in cell wall biosynthesis